MIGIIALLIAISVTMYSASIGESRRAVCQANLRSFSLAFLAHRQDHPFLPEARYGVSIPLGYLAPLDELQPYLGTPMPALEPDGSIDAPQPFRCPADARFASENGFSYGYVPSAFMPIIGAEETTRMYERSPHASIVLMDMGPVHLSRSAPVPDIGSLAGRHALRFDGAVNSADGSS